MSRTQAVKPAALAAGAERSFQMPADWWLASWDSWAESQRLWLAAAIPWQQTLIAAQRDLWDGWTSRWAGGVPIDA